MTLKYSIKPSQGKFVQVALAQITLPLGLADWETQIAQTLPEELVGSLPSVEDLEKELGNEL